MIKYTGLNRLLNYLPARKLTCKHCDFNDFVKMGLIRFSRINYGGPYCPKCGSKLMNKGRGK